MPQTPLEQYQKRLDEETLRPDRAQLQVVNALQRLYEEAILGNVEKKPGWKFWEKDKPIKGLYIYGGVGRGKSMLMDMFYDCVPEDMKKERVHFHAFMIEVHNYFHERREMDDINEGIDGLLPSLASIVAARAQVLCFDEFHVTDVADAMILGRLFTALFDRGVLIVSTSNWPPDRLYEGGLQRDRFLPFIELLKSKTECLHLDSPTDYRAETLQQEGTYFWPLGDLTDRRVDALFCELTDMAHTGRDYLDVKGRTIKVQTVANGVARFTFAELCERPHGAEDYLKIAESYRTIFLEKIPKMGYDRRNEAKRLMTLIDALYETGTKLVISAEAPADQLYYGDDHAFEFERTVSRLLEMQSEKYLAK